VFPDPKGLLLCEHFHPRDKRYERDCPPQYTGCLTQTNGKHKARLGLVQNNRITKNAVGIQFGGGGGRSGRQKICL
jgi:hypothetical protein